MQKISKVLVIGSGPIIIGQAAEFDYAGTQACKSLREEGIITVLINSNPATIMTDEGIADIIYIEPLSVDVVSRIIERERPDGLLPTLGGQTGLNLAVDLADAGVLDKYNVRLLGTSINTIRKAEDRGLFKQMLISIGEPVPLSFVATNMQEARNAVSKIGLPVVIRPAFTLGGSGGGHASTIEEFETAAYRGISISPVHQILIEQSVIGWKEIEYEVMRDAANTCITICNMENIDPMGIHTGDSIVVAPSQTLSDREYQMLRSASLKIIRELGIEGGCNVQFALAPTGNKSDLPPYYVIEVNPRVSRSSALASKATGYPIARVAAKIAIGKRLDEVTNKVTGKTTAAFEPALDYVVVKIPRWPFDKFASGDRSLGIQMKSTGEVMAIDRTFEAAFLKAVRSLEISGKSLLWEDISWKDKLPLHPNDLRFWAVMAALRRGMTIDEVNRQTSIDKWFLYKFQNIVQIEKRLLAEPLTHQLLIKAKKMGFSDAVIGTLADKLPEQVRELRHKWNIKPVYKTVDTCAAEFASETPYFYSAYDVENEAISLVGPKAVTIGSGPIRIGQGIEFDYCSVQSAWALQEVKVQSIMINSNPETVSTDFDTSDRLYFEALDEESIRDILENEAVSDDVSITYPGSIVQFGGQTAINMANHLFSNSLPILGSSAETIDLAEDRGRFEHFLNQLGIPQPPGGGVTSIEEALNVADRIGYPVLVRPSYVLGGRAMEIVHNGDELVRYISMAIELGKEHPVLVDKYMRGKEVEVDAICDGERVFIPGIMEHIERAGVHSGDAMTVYPALRLSMQEAETIVDYSIRIGLELKIKGLMNVQYVVTPPEEGSIESGSVYVIEVNPRASRTVPFLSKITGVPMVRVATKVMIGFSLQEQGYEMGLLKSKKLVGIKAPVFSMAKLSGVDTYLGPEMKSTGEVMGIDRTFKAALNKALIAAGLSLPPHGGLLVSIADRDKAEAIPLIRKFSEAGYRIYATEGTSRFIEAAGIQVKMIVQKIGSGHPDVIDIIENGSVNTVVNTLTERAIPLRDGFEIRRVATERRIPCFTSLDTARAAIDTVISGGKTYNVLPLSEYLKT
ncbi:MAG: carbamoyl-phosphate synthase large subunit [Chloroflexi bacterium]|nr:carbamoyl-phosphate synthase large subunit [Chloroflexota bacterium]